MTNPNNAIGTNGAYSGRTSVDAFNDILSAFNGRGIVSGWSVSPSSGMTIALGGVSGIRDVAIAVATGGAKTTINNRSGSPVSLTIEAAPATNSRIDAIVAYVSNPPQGTTELADNPSACGLIAVKGTTASTPTAPTESMIRTAITADGAVGSTAYYVVLGTVKVVAGVTTLTSNYITQGAKAAIGTDQIADSAVTSDKIDFTTFKFGMESKKNDANFSFTAPSAGTLYVFGMASYMWGYDGGSIRLGYTKLSGTASIGTNYSTVITGGNTVSRSISCMATVPMSKGNTINMALTRTDGVSTGTSIENYGHFYFFVPS